MKKGIYSWKNIIKFVEYYFSISGLLRTIFVPWRRDEYKHESGIWGFFEMFIFNIFSRILGFIIRSITIIVGLILIIIIILLFPLFLIFPIKISYESLVRFGSLGREWAYPITFKLDKHGIDMNKLPDYLVIDHDSSIKKIERILSRNTNQNVLLIGSQGIGKTTRLSFLARKMYRDLSMPALNGKRLVKLYPEEMGVDEIISCVKEAINSKNIILVIENIERFNFLGILIPFLENNNFQMILTTDLSSYHSKFKYNQDLMSLVEVIECYPSSDDITMLYLEDWCNLNNKKHKFSHETLSAVVILTNKLIMNSYQPEKSIRILEELITIHNKSILPEDVENLLSQKLGVPLGLLKSDEKDKLIYLEDVLRLHIIGQDEAIHSIASSLKRTRAGVVDSKKPIGSFLFLGTTGVGKTHTAKMLAEYYFESEHLMSRFDMSEFIKLDSINHFVNRLSISVERKPYSLLFFDEIEKAHPDILNLFLQILDEGQMHTESGRLISFRNNIIICTSNAGSSYLMKNDVVSKDLLINFIINNGILKPEFINRFDNVVLYNQLDRDSIKKITRISLEKLNNFLLKKQNLYINITDELVDFIARKGHDIKFGVRPLNRVIQDYIETQVADRILYNDIPKNRVIDVKIPPKI